MEKKTDKTKTEKRKGDKVVKKKRPKTHPDVVTARSTLKKLCPKIESEIFDIVYYVIPQEEEDAEKIRVITKALLKASIRCIKSTTHTDSLERVEKRIYRKLIKSISSPEIEERFLAKFIVHDSLLMVTIQRMSMMIIDLQELMHKHKDTLSMYISKHGSLFDEKHQKKHRKSTDVVNSGKRIDYIIFPGFKQDDSVICKEFVMLK